MIAKFLIKKPMLMIGILCMVIFMFQLQKQGLLSRRDKVTPYSCRAVLVKLDRRISKWHAKEWKSSCDKNNLIIEVSLPKDLKLPDDMTKTKMLLYRELANSLVFIAKHSPYETLERTDTITVTLNAPPHKLVALGFGKELALFATLTDEKMIAAHLQKSITVKEDFKPLAPAENLKKR